MVFNIPMKQGLRVVALMEACKGLLVIFAGLALFSLMHHNVQVAAEQLLAHAHLNPAKHSPKIFIEAATHMADGKLRFIAVLALLYSLMRFIEAYGLWFARRWAEWFALLSGGVYIPIELYELAQGFAWLKIGLVIVNLLVVVYLARVILPTGVEREQ
jgi:uncharacterized membrane protein (DUF2068 family)